MPENIAPELRIPKSTTSPKPNSLSTSIVGGSHDKPPPPPLTADADANAAAAAPAGEPPPPEGGPRATLSGDSNRGGWTASGFLAASVRRPSSGGGDSPSSRGAVGPRSSLGDYDRDCLDCLRVLLGWASSASCGMVRDCGWGFWVVVLFLDLI